MNKNIKILFLSLTLFMFIVALGSTTAADVNNDTQTISTADNQSQAEITKISDTKKQNSEELKNIQKGKKSIEKQIKRTQNTEVTDFTGLKNTWNTIQTTGDQTTEYVINLKNGQYNFEEQLESTSTSNAKYITINGQDTDKTILNGQNKTRFFNINNTGQVIKFNNITFINGFNDSRAGAIYSDAQVSIINNSKFINNTVLNQTGALFGGALCLGYNATVTNSSFINNTISTIAQAPANITSFDQADGGAIYYSNNINNSCNITLCEFINNSASAYNTNGGAISTTTFSRVNITSCDFLNNSVKSSRTTLWISGGAIYLDELKTVYGKYVNFCVFENNTAISGKNIGVSGVSYQEDPVDDIFGNYYPDKSDNNFTITFLTNDKLPVKVINQNTKTVTIKAIAETSYCYKSIKSLGTGYEIPITSSSSLIDTTNLKLTPANGYTVQIDTTKLPENHENITLYVDGVETTKIVWETTKAEVNNITAKAGDTVQIKATFKTNNDIDIPGGKVAFKLNGRTIGHTNIEFGTAKLNYTIPDNYSAKKYTITAVYGGSNQFIKAKTTSTLKILKQDTKTTIKVENNTAGSSMQITVTVKDEKNNTIKKGKTAIKINGKTIQKINLNETNTVTFKLTNSWADKNMTITAVYGENTNYNQNKADTTIKIQKNTKTKTIKKEEAVNNYYVSAENGSDSNTGTQDSPFKTIQKAITMAQTSGQPTNIYLSGTFKGAGNTNLTVPGDLHINFIGINNTVIDGEVNYTYNTEGGYYWGSDIVWEPYRNGTGNWAMSITQGTGLITINNMTIQNCWNPEDQV